MIFRACTGFCAVVWCCWLMVTFTGESLSAQTSGAYWNAAQRKSAPTSRCPSRQLPYYFAKYYYAALVRRSRSRRAANAKWSVCKARAVHNTCRRMGLVRRTEQSVCIVARPLEEYIRRMYFAKSGPGGAEKYFHPLDVWFQALVHKRYTKRFPSCNDHDYLACSAMDSRWQDRRLRFLNCYNELNKTCPHFLRAKNTLPKIEYQQDCSMDTVASCVRLCSNLYFRAKQMYHHIKQNERGSEAYSPEMSYSDSVVQALLRVTDKNDKLYPAAVRMQYAVDCVSKRRHELTADRGNYTDCTKLLCDDTLPPRYPNCPQNDDWVRYLTWHGKADYALDTCPPKGKCELEVLSNCALAVARHKSQTAPNVMLDSLDNCFTVRWKGACDAYTHKPWEAAGSSPTCVPQYWPIEWQEHASSYCLLIKMSRLRKDLWAEHTPYLADIMAWICKVSTVKEFRQRCPGVELPTVHSDMSVWRQLHLHKRYRPPLVAGESDLSEAEKMWIAALEVQGGRNLTYIIG